jgi:hypothetical protein
LSPGYLRSATLLGRETAHGFAVSFGLDSGKKFCASTPISASKSIYQKIGYQPICDVQDWSFE